MTINSRILALVSNHQALRRFNADWGGTVTHLLFRMSGAVPWGWGEGGQWPALCISHTCPGFLIGRTGCSSAAQLFKLPTVRDCLPDRLVCLCWAFQRRCFLTQISCWISANLPLILTVIFADPVSSAFGIETKGFNPIWVFACWVLTRQPDLKDLMLLCALNCDFSGSFVSTAAPFNNKY